MDKDLFPNSQSEESLANLLAKRKIDEKNNELEKLEEEYDKYKTVLDEIFMSSAIKYSFKDFINYLSGSDNELAKQVQEFKLSCPYEDLLTIELIEKNVKAYLTREKMLVEIQKDIDVIYLKYPHLEEIDLNEALNEYPFIDILKMIEPDLIHEEKDTIKEDKIADLDFGESYKSEQKTVINIKKAPEILSDKIKKEQSPVENQIDNPEDVVSEQSFFNNVDEDFASLFDKPLTPKTLLKDEEEQTDEIVPKEENHNVISPFLSEDNDYLPENKSAEINNLEDNLNIKMEDGMTLKNIALAFFENENRWPEIYQANQSILETRIIEKNYQNIDEIQNDPNLFSGIDLIIPRNNSLDLDSKKMAA